MQFARIILTYRSNLADFKVKEIKMTGFELVKMLRSTKGKIFAFVPTVHDGIYLPVDKSQLIEWCNGCGDSENDMQLSFINGNFYFDPSNN